MFQLMKPLTLLSGLDHRQLKRHVRPYFRRVYSRGLKTSGVTSKMLIYLDGPEKSGKTTLSHSIMERYESDRSAIIKWIARDPLNGMGYLPMFYESLASQDIHVWDRGWVSEVVYGQLLQQERWFAQDPFLCEWVYGRAMIGRGGRFIVLPVDPDKLRELRDHTDLPVDYLDEAVTYGKHAKEWGYEILFNEYTPETLNRNTFTACKSLLTPHHLPIEDYVGPKNPLFVFVNGNQEPQERIPFEGPNFARLFSQFGTPAIRDFGYASIEGFRKLTRQMQKRGITYGRSAKYYYPDLPNIPAAGKWGMESQREFMLGALQAIRTMI